MIRYLDTSAALKLLIEEPESAVLAENLQRSVREGHVLASSFLLFTELHCAAGRRAEIGAEAVREVLDGVALADLSRADLTRAGTSAWGLRSADALHLAVSLRLGVDEIVTYDLEMTAAAVRAGLHVSAPGREGDPGA